MNPFLSQVLSTVKKALDPDRALQSTMSAFIDANAGRHALYNDGEHWEPGKALKLLLAGYVGTRNTGADVRVEEMIRQFRALLGDDQVELTIMTVDKKLSSGYFRTVKQVHLPAVFPKFLYDECPKHHGVIACEGSMFKSKFANALSAMMAGALGMASSEGKLAVGYGAEAGHMNPSLRDYVRKHCRDSLIICRNEPSKDVLGRLDVRTTSGTDTAWTFTPAPLEVGRELLRAKGWDGKKPVVAVCPINPFWWPVKPDVAKAFAHKFMGQFEVEHYKSIYFHHSSQEVDEKYHKYLDGLAFALETFVKEKDYFPILVGMEQIDRRSAEALATRLPFDAPLFISDEYDMYQLVSVIRNCSLMASSRYHAIVTSMPGLVPSIGVTMDERIRNLMNDRGHPDFFLEVDDDDLGERLLGLFHKVHNNSEAVREDIARTIPAQLKLMGQMGIDFLDELSRVYPEFPRIDRPRIWYNHLPPLPESLEKLIEQHA
jgi:polysaccharide pyruvyl transferase WcaK-like protein